MENFCDIQNGLCGDISKPNESEKNPTVSKNKVRLEYYTDPICSACWIIESDLDRLIQKYDIFIEFNIYMGGLLPSWENFHSGDISKPSDVALHWEAIGQRYGIPISGQVWLSDPPSSSTPASVAYHKVKLVIPGKENIFLKEVRKSIFIYQKNIAKWSILNEIATHLKLNISFSEKDLLSEAANNFKLELINNKQKGIRGFPTLIFKNHMGEQSFLVGIHSYQEMEKKLLSLLS